MSVLRVQSPTRGGTYRLLAELPVEIESYTLEPLSQPIPDRRTRRTTVVHLHGREDDGDGEDVTPTEPDQLAFQHSGPTLPLPGTWTMESFSSLLQTLDLFPVAPPHPALRSFRRWAFESAALDLALRQAGLSLADALDREPRPVRFVNSLKLPGQPTIAPILRRLELYPTLRFKLDPTPDWDEQLLEELAATGAVDTLDLKGQYPLQAPIAQPPDAQLYARVAQVFPDAWIEDPALTPATRNALRRHRDRITWDYPIRTIADIDKLPFRPRAVNIKPARIGKLKTLLDIHDHCARSGIAPYGGGMFELGPGRGQIQYLASLFHPNAPNDVAPSAYNHAELAPGMPTSPINLAPPTSGFRSG